VNLDSLINYIKLLESNSGIIGSNLIKSIDEYIIIIYNIMIISLVNFIRTIRIRFRHYWFKSN